MQCEVWCAHGEREACEGSVGRACMAPATAASAQTLLHALPYNCISLTAIATKLALLTAHCTSALLQGGIPHVLFEVALFLIFKYVSNY